jgi:hemerythrin
VQEFDKHHQHLVGLLNKSFDEFERNAPPKELESIINELVDYAAYHFAAEEQWMAQNAYPKLAEHAQMHDSFSSEVLAFQEDFIAGKVSLNLDLFSFLVDWLVGHILETDADYGKFNADKDKYLSDAKS